MRNLLAKLKDAMYKGDNDLLYNPFKKSQDFFILQIVFATMFGVFTGNVYLTGYAGLIKASDVLTGYITILPNLCGLFLFVSSIFVERLRSKKKTVITLTIAAKSLICSIILIPLFIPQSMQGGAMFVILALAFTLQGLNGIVLNNWFISVVPYNIRGRYFSIRQTFALILNIVFPMATGILMDAIKNKYAGFSVLFVFALISMIFEVYTYAHIAEPETESIGSNETRLLRMLAIPIKNKEFMSYVAYMFVFFLILYISTTYSSVYFIKYLKLPYTFMNFVGVLFSLAQLFFYRRWGRICDSKGNQFVLTTSVWLFLGESLCFGLMSGHMVYVLMPVAYILSGIANSGFAVGVFNRRFAIAPEKGRMLYDGFYSTAIGLAFLIGPLIGSILNQNAASIPFVNKIQYGQFRILYFMTFTGILLLQLIKFIRSKKSSAATVENDIAK